MRNYEKTEHNGPARKEAEKIMRGRHKLALTQTTKHDSAASQHREFPELLS